jgi:hypothetical protein
VVLDKDEYLPPATKTWCENQLAAWGFRNPSEINREDLAPDGVNRVHVLMYVQLREAVARHMQGADSTNPELGLTPPPLGGRNWKKPSESVQRQLAASSFLQTVDYDARLEYDESGGEETEED